MNNVKSFMGRIGIVQYAALKKPLRDKAFKLYCALCTYADKDSGECWPSHSRLAADVGCRERYVRRLLAELEMFGLIHIKHRPVEGGKNDTNIYTVLNLQNEKA